MAWEDGPRILSGGVNVRDGFKVCYGSGDSYYTAECPGGEAAPFHDFSENILAGVIERAEYFHLSRRHFAITEYPDIFKSFTLYIPRLRHPFGNGFGRLFLDSIDELGGIYGMHKYLKIKSIHYGT